MDFITSHAELRAHYRQPSDGAVRKELRALDHHSRSFIARSPFVLIGSQDEAGNADVTPKGDKPGFVAVLDDTTIAIPDRPGNNRLDTWENIVANPAVGLLFLIPGMNETLRINGRGRITVDDALRARLAVDGKLPVSVLLVSVQASYMHCAKAFMRSDLWKPETWPDRAKLPTLGQILRDQLALCRERGRPRCKARPVVLEDDVVEGQTIRLLGISGSLRRWSTNTALLRAMVAAVPPGVVLEIFDGLSMLPIFNPDCLEGRIPAVVAKWEEKVRQSSGVIIASPEYAHGIPGGLKNALDWLVAGDAAPSKPAMLVHASPRSHIAREALREVLKKRCVTPVCENG